MKILNNPIVIGILIGLPSFLLGYLGYRRSRKADVTTAASDAISQILDGLNKLIDSLQEDNLVLRTQITALQTRFEATISERDQLKQRIAKITGMGCIIAFVALLVLSSVRRDEDSEQRMVNRAARVAENAVDKEVDRQLDERGVTTTSSIDVATPAVTVTTIPTTTTTVPIGATTTTEAPPIVSVPIPTTVPELPTTLPTLPEVTVP